MNTSLANTPLSLVSPLNAIGVRGRHLAAWAGALCVLCIIGPTPVAADDVAAGIDLWKTKFPTSKGNLSSCPIPADFFGPGSDPFDGAIQFEGKPLGDPFGDADTIVERLQDAILPVCEDTSSSGPGTCSSDTVPIKIVALSLKSAGSITVTFNGGASSQQWNVQACLSDEPQTLGTMTINHDCELGGEFTAVVTVLYKLIFTRGNETLTLDAGAPGGVPCNPIVFKSSGPWVHDAAPEAAVTVGPGAKVDGNCDGVMETLTTGTSNFFPGYEAICDDFGDGPLCNECCEKTCSAAKKQTVTEAPDDNSAKHTVEPPSPPVPLPPPPPNGTPTVSQWGMIILMLLLLGGIAIKFGRQGRSIEE